MRAVIQRVRRASVKVDGQTVGHIDHGIAVLLGIARDDGPAEVERLADKLPTLRIFSDETGKMNQALQDVGGSLLVISQFTLLADIERGRRPSFERAAPPAHAQRLYDQFVQRLRAKGLRTETGIFGASMVVSLENDGPVTLILDTATWK